MTNLSNLIILVDDDPFSNLIAKKIIEKNLGEVNVKEFVIPESALEYIETEFEHRQVKEKITLFLDINMPTLTGWEFLEEFETFAASIKNQFNIYILSSSINPADILRAQQNPLVIDFVEKPINKEFLIKTFVGVKS